MQPIIFVRIASMLYYQGITDKDSPVNGGSYVKETGQAHECFSFAPAELEDGRKACLGYAQLTGGSDIGKLMHDFNCTDAADMNFKLLADRTRYLKENPKGVSEMCKVIEDMRKEERTEERIEIAKNMLLDGMLSLEKIAEYARLSLEEVKKLQVKRFMMRQ